MICCSIKSGNPGQIAAVKLPAGVEGSGTRGLDNKTCAWNVALMGCASSDGGLQSAPSLSSQTAAPRENVLAAAPAPKDFASLALVFANDVLQLRTKGPQRRLSRALP